MKKYVIMAGVAAAMMSVASCCGDNKSCNAAACGKCDAEKVYTGVMPAADVAGVRYTLALDYDDNGSKGDYTLLETYIQADSTAAFGYVDAVSYASEGDFTVGKQGDKTYLKLVKDAKDSSAQASDNLYFLVDSDSTLTLTNQSLEVSSTPGMNYTLTLAK